MIKCLSVRGAVCALGLLSALSFLPTVANGQLRVVTYNITSYSGGRDADLKNVFYGTFEGRSMSPDVILVEEVTSQAAVNALVNILNTAVGSPGDWAAATFVNGPDSDSACFYRTSKVDLLGVTTVAVGGVSPNHPRNIMRYDLRLEEYTSDKTVVACYASHMKAQESGTDDDNRRLLEAQRIRDDAESLNADWCFLYGGDTNIQTNTDIAYVELVGSQANNDGRFFDPINRPGSWNNNATYRFIHTQDPAGAGGMDDRHDQLLLCADLIDGDGFDYIGNPAIPYSNSTWNDANHSYRAWGNDGSSFNLALTTVGNTMVGESIALSLRAAATTGGHLPVFLDLRVPPRVDAPLLIDFGQVPVGGAADQIATVLNDGNTALWTAAGIANLNYSLSASAGFTAPAGSFVETAGGGGNNHVISMDTSTAGVLNGTLTITSNAPDEPVIHVTLTGEVVADVECIGDLDGNLIVDPQDLALLLASFGVDAGGDLDGDLDTDPQDLAMLLANWEADCH